MRTGKTPIGILWADHPCRNENAYIVTRKANMKDWGGYRPKAKLLSQHGFMQEDIVDPTALVIDEAHMFASPLFLKGRSARATKLYNLVRRYPDCDILLLTATPVKNDAWSLHSLLCFMGAYYDWKWWREEFFEREAMPFLTRPKWMKKDEVPMRWAPRDDWRERLQPYLDKHADKEDLGKRDKEDIIVRIKQPKYVEPEDKLVTWTHEHKHEQQNKAAEIKALKYSKAIVVAFYTEQIDELAAELGKLRPVFVMDGRSKDPDAVLKKAQKAEHCYLIVQSSVGYGWDGWMFEGMIFASTSHKAVDHTQMRGRLRSTKHLEPVDYVYLLGGRWDRKIYQTVKSGKDFHAPRTPEAE